MERIREDWIPWDEFQLPTMSVWCREEKIEEKRGLELSTTKKLCTMFSQKIENEIIVFLLIKNGDLIVFWFPLESLENCEKLRNDSSIEYDVICAGNESNSLILCYRLDRKEFVGVIEREYLGDR